MKVLKSTNKISFNYKGDLYMIDLQDKIWSLNNKEARLFKDHKNYVDFTDNEELIFGAEHGFQMFKAPEFTYKLWKLAKRIKI